MVLEWSCCGEARGGEHAVPSARSPPEEHQAEVFCLTPLGVQESKAGLGSPPPKERGWAPVLFSHGVRATLGAMRLWKWKGTQGNVGRAWMEAKFEAECQRGASHHHSLPRCESYLYVSTWLDHNIQR